MIEAHAPHHTPIRFPHLVARNLEGDAVSLPDDLEGDRNVVIVAFRRAQQALVDSWVPWLEAHAKTDPALRFYEVPTIGLQWSPARRFIDGGMATALPDRAVRRRTLTVYTDVRRVTDGLGIDDTETIWLFLVDRDGTVRWRARGGFESETAAALEHALLAPVEAPGTDADSTQFDFAFEGRFRPLLAVLGVTPSTAHVTVTADRIVARFGPWSCDTELANVSCVQITGPYRWYRAIGPRGSFADHGLTFGSTTTRGVCLEFREPVHGLDPFSALAHPGLTLTLEDCDGFAALVRARAGL